jgi:hypothetical protein
MNCQILFVGKVDLAQRALKAGDIIRLKENCRYTVCGIYLGEHSSRSDLGDGVSEGYCIYNVLTFDDGTTHQYFDWEYESNLTEE